MFSALIDTPAGSIRKSSRSTQRLSTGKATSHAATLAPTARKDLAVAVLSRTQPMTRPADGHDVSREFLYRHAAKARRRYPRAGRLDAKRHPLTGRTQFGHTPRTVRLHPRAPRTTGRPLSPSHPAGPEKPRTPARRPAGLRRRQRRALRRSRSHRCSLPVAQWGEIGCQSLLSSPTREQYFVV